MIELSKAVEHRRPNLLRILAPRFADPKIISFAAGYPSAESFPLEQMSEISKNVILERGLTALQYGPTDGMPSFRESVIEKYLIPFKKLKGVRPNELLVTTGSTQAFDLINKAVLNPGDTVLVENPTFGGTMTQFEIAQVKTVGVEADDDGVIPEDLEDKIRKYHPKLFYVIPTFQNPTGRTLSLERRKKVAELAAKYDFFIVEDDPYSDLRFRGEAIPPIKYFDTADKVNLVCSFSKLFAPGLRLAVVLPPKELYGTLYYVKMGADMLTSSLVQAIADEFLRQDLLDGQVQKIIRLYKDRWNKMETAMKRFFPKDVSWVDIDGGMFTWMRLPGGSEKYDALAMLEDCMENYGVAYMPTASFFIDQTIGQDTIRLNFTSAPYDRMEEGIEKLGHFLKKNIQ